MQTAVEGPVSLLLLNREVWIRILTAWSLTHGRSLSGPLVLDLVACSHGAWARSTGVGVRALHGCMIDLVGVVVAICLECW